MKRLSSKAKVKFGVVASSIFAASSAFAVVPTAPTPVTVDLSAANTSITNAGTALIGLAVAIISFGIVYNMLRKRG